MLGQPRSLAVPINQAFVQLADVIGESVIIENYTTVTIEVKRGAGTVYYVIPPDTGREIDVAENANELSVRNGTDNTTVNVTYHVVGEEI